MTAEIAEVLAASAFAPLGLVQPLLHGILGVHRIKERPVVKDGQIVIGNVMLLSLSFDHRIVDGHVGAAFAYDIIASLENPERMFLEM